MTSPSNQLDLRIPALKAGYVQRTLMPSTCVAQLLKRIDDTDRPEVWISRVPKK